MICGLYGVPNTPRAVFHSICESLGVAYCFLSGADGLVKVDIGERHEPFPIYVKTVDVALKTAHKIKPPSLLFISDAPQRLKSLRGIELLGVRLHDHGLYLGSSLTIQDVQSVLDTAPKHACTISLETTTPVGRILSEVSQASALSSIQTGLYSIKNVEVRKVVQDAVFLWLSGNSSKARMIAAVHSTVKNAEDFLAQVNDPRLVRIRDAASQILHGKLTFETAEAQGISGYDLRYVCKRFQNQKDKK
jgi:hypothetical protein